MWSTFQYFRRHVRIYLSFTATSEDIVIGVIPERAIEYQRNEFSYLEFAWLEWPYVISIHSLIVLGVRDRLLFNL